MLTGRRRLLVGVAAVAMFAGSTAAADLIVTDTTQPDWTGLITGWHYDAQEPHRLTVMYRQVGTSTDTVDETSPVAFTDVNGNVQNENVSRFVTLDMSPYLPADATVASLSVKTIITNQNAYVSDVFVFVKAVDATIPGPTESPDTPVDFSVSTNPLHTGIAAQSVLQGPGGIRDFVPIVVPVQDGKVQVAWGYQLHGNNALGFDLYLDGYGN